MKELDSLEKIINSELTSKIISSKIKHNQILITIHDNNLIEVLLFLKTNSITKFRQLIEITAVDYPEKDQRFRMVYLLLSHESNSRIVIDYYIKRK
jgi:NADH:ubiquinone oxidoreductase 27 kD subunit